VWSFWRVAPVPRPKGDIDVLHQPPKRMKAMTPSGAFPLVASGETTIE